MLALDDERAPLVGRFARRRSGAAGFELRMRLASECHTVNRTTERRVEVGRPLLAEIRSHDLVDRLVRLKAAPLGLAHDEVGRVRLQL